MDRAFRKGNAVVTFPIAALSGDRRDAAGAVGQIPKHMIKENMEKQLE